MLIKSSGKFSRPFSDWISEMCPTLVRFHSTDKIALSGLFELLRQLKHFLDLSKSSISKSMIHRYEQLMMTHKIAPTQIVRQVSQTIFQRF